MTVEDREVIASPVGFVHSKDFMRNFFVGKSREAFWLTTCFLSDPLPNKDEGMLGWIDSWEASLSKDMMLKLIKFIQYDNLEKDN